MGNYIEVWSNNSEALGINIYDSKIIGDTIKVYGRNWTRGIYTHSSHIENCYIEVQDHYRWSGGNGIAIENYQNIRRPKIISNEILISNWTKGIWGDNCDIISNTISLPNQNDGSDFTTDWQND